MGGDVTAEVRRQLFDDGGSGLGVADLVRAAAPLAEGGELETLQSEVVASLIGLGPLDSLMG